MTHTVPPFSSAKQAYDAALGMMRQGHFSDARESLEFALSGFSNDLNLIRLIGICLGREGRLDQAAERLKHVTLRAPTFAPAHEALADVLFRQGQVDGAIQSYETALKHNPNSQSASHRLAEILMMVGRGREADDYMERSLEQNPDRKDLVEAMELHRQDKVQEAEVKFQTILRRNPRNVDALRLMGVLMLKMERYNDAEAFFQSAVDVAPDFRLAWNNLGTALNEQGKFDEAHEAFEAALELSSGNVSVLNNIANNHANAGRLEEALSVYHQASSLDDRHFPTWLGMGHILKTLGQQSEAIDAYRRCIEIYPDFGEAFWSLSNLKTFQFDDTEVKDMERRVERDRLEKEAAIAFSFSLGKAHEDRKDYAKAFHYYSKGNDAKRWLVDYDPLQLDFTADRLIEVFSKEFFEERKGWGHSDAAPIFILGLPRSGSTLLEQILSSHSEVEGTAELSDVMRIATFTGFNRTDAVKYPETMVTLNARQLSDLGQDYIDATMHHRTPLAYFTDKMPNNFPAIGFIHSVLPNAKIIDARRHPLDSCLGSFKQLFAKGQVFSYDLFDLAQYYTQYIRLIEHWNVVLPGKILTVHYEDVVTDLETQARRIADHCGLGWEDSMLRFHETKRAVRTASSEQVRQPIYTGSMNLWRNYEGHLGELIEYLEPVLMRLPLDQRPRSLQD